MFHEEKNNSTIFFILKIWYTSGSITVAFLTFSSLSLFGLLVSWFCRPCTMRPSFSHFTCSYNKPDMSTIYSIAIVNDGTVEANKLNICCRCTSAIFTTKKLCTSIRFWIFWWVEFFLLSRLPRYFIYYLRFSIENSSIWCRPTNSSMNLNMKFFNKRDWIARCLAQSLTG